MILNVPALLKTCWLRQINRCTITRMAGRGLMEKGGSRKRILHTGVCGGRKSVFLRQRGDGLRPW